MYNIAKCDFMNCIQLAHKDTIVIVDDNVLHLDLRKIGQLDQLKYGLKDVMKSL